MNARSADLHPLPLVAPVTHSRDIYAVEIGAAVTRLTRFNSQGQCVAPILSAPTPSYLSQPRESTEAIRAALFETLRQHALDLFGDEDPGAVVVAYPGPVTADGIARRSPTLFGPNSDRQDDIRSALGALWPRSRIHVLNDATCAGYHYVERGHKDFCVITIDATVSNKVFLNGSPCIGATGYGGEIGHLKVGPQPGTPGDGMHRELGQIASGRGTVWLSRTWERAAGVAPLADGSELSAASDALIAAFRAGDAQARAVVRAAAHPLAVSIGALHLGLGLTRFFIVGEFAKALGQGYRALLTGWCRELTWSVGQNWDRMIELGEDSADETLSGAAYVGTQRAGD